MFTQCHSPVPFDSGVLQPVNRFIRENKKLAYINIKLVLIHHSIKLATQMK